MHIKTQIYGMHEVRPLILTHDIVGATVRIYHKQEETHIKWSPHTHCTDVSTASQTAGLMKTIEK